MKKITILLAIIFQISGCSFPTFKEEVAIASSDELEFAVDTINDAPPVDIKVEEQKISDASVPDELPAVTEAEGQLGQEQAMAIPEEPKFKDYMTETTPEITPAQTDLAGSGREEQYRVQKGDTLMLVAFKIYGDYRKWKELKEWNTDKLKSKMYPGLVLRYFEPKHSFSLQSNGLPYLIKTGDTLQAVSLEKYGTTKKWKSIYENNQPLIRDPDLIFAGFTIYYVAVRDLASEHK